MSYILDALRRAEADRDRERGQVPGLHTLPSSGREASVAAGRRGWLPWAAGGVLLLGGIGMGTWLASGPQEAPAPAPGPATQAPVIAPPPAPAVVSSPLPQPAASASPYLPPVPPAPPPVAVAAPPPPPPAQAAAPVQEVRIPRLAELPESTRRELPALAISGSVYSEDPAGRFVIINGEVQREGARLAADLVLEKIGARELVLRFKGQRYRQPV